MMSLDNLFVRFCAKFEDIPSIIGQVMDTSRKFKPNTTFAIVLKCYQSLGLGKPSIFDLNEKTGDDVSR